MEKSKNTESQDISGSRFNQDIFSKSVRAGKRTYFFDVKSTRQDELYLTITESKRRFEQDGAPVFDKHKIFLYREDFDKFVECLQEIVGYINENQAENLKQLEELTNSGFTTVDFEDLDK